MTRVRLHSCEGDAEDFAMACDEFCDAFYLDYPDEGRLQTHLDPRRP